MLLIRFIKPFWRLIKRQPMLSFFIQPTICSVVEAVYLCLALGLNVLQSNRYFSLFFYLIPQPDLVIPHFLFFVAIIGFTIGLSYVSLKDEKIFEKTADGLVVTISMRMILLPFYFSRTRKYNERPLKLAIGQNIKAFRRTESVITNHFLSLSEFSALPDLSKVVLFITHPLDHNKRMNGDVIESNTNKLAIVTVLEKIATLGAYEIIVPCDLILTNRPFGLIPTIKSK